MKNNPSIIVIGSINIDLVVKTKHFPKDGETVTGFDFFTASGGKGANQAVAATRLGADVSLIGAVGNDKNGKYLLKDLQGEKINTRGVYIAKDSPSGTAIITLDNNAHNQIIVVPGANHKIPTSYINKPFSVTKNTPQALLVQLEIPIQQVLYAVKQAKKKGLIVVFNPAPAHATSKELLSVVDYIIPNEHEAAVLTNQSNPEEAGKILRGLGAKQVLITLGKRGVLYFDKGKPVYIKPYNVHAIDPTAAGDAFVAAFGVATLEGKSLKEALEWAQAAGALTTTKLGAQPSLPTREELLNFLHTHKK